MWIFRIKLRSAGLSSKRLYLLIHLTDLKMFYKCMVFCFITFFIMIEIFVTITKPVPM